MVNVCNTSCLGLSSNLPTVLGNSPRLSRRAQTRQGDEQGSFKVARQLQLQEEDSASLQENRSPLASPLAEKLF